MPGIKLESAVFKSSALPTVLSLSTLNTKPMNTETKYSKYTKQIYYLPPVNNTTQMRKHHTMYVCKPYYHYQREGKGEELKNGQEKFKKRITESFTATEK